ncbi:MAG: FliM/FliN family flagellar motor switch protein [Chromatiales bacterium]|nr:FliM/FliN family flagellar motor switch protein [Chromatiales bacterium]
MGRALVDRWTEGAPVDAGNVAPLVSLREGLEAESVVVEVVVGSAELTLTELQSLSLGDVLRLDRGLKEPLTVLFDGGRQVVWCAPWSGCATAGPCSWGQRKFLAGEASR